MEVLQRQRHENEAFAALAQQTVKLATGEMVTLEGMVFIACEILRHRSFIGH